MPMEGLLLPGESRVMHVQVCCAPPTHVHKNTRALQLSVLVSRRISFLLLADSFLLTPGILSGNSLHSSWLP